MRFSESVAAVTALVMVLGSCSRAVHVPLDPEPRIQAGSLYKVTTNDDQEFETRDLVLSDERISFTSAGIARSFPRADVKNIQKLEVDGPRTFVATLAIGAVAVTALYFLLLGGFGAASSAN